MPEGEAFFSAEFKDLFQSLMKYDPSERATIDQIKNHPWYLGESATQEEAV